MADHKMKGIVLLGSATVGLQNGDGKSTAYTVPPGKCAAVVDVIIAEPTASLADGTDFDIGVGADCDSWKQTNDLSSMTSTDDFMVINSPNVKYSVLAAGEAFGIKPITGATADAEGTMMVLGIEWDA